MHQKHSLRSLKYIITYYWSTMSTLSQKKTHANVFTKFYSIEWFIGLIITITSIHSINLNLNSEVADGLFNNVILREYKHSSGDSKHFQFEHNILRYDWFDSTFLHLILAFYWFRLRDSVVAFNFTQKHWKIKQFVLGALGHQWIH